MRYKPIPFPSFKKYDSKKGELSSKDFEHYGWKAELVGDGLYSYEHHWTQGDFVAVPWTGMYGANKEPSFFGSWMIQGTHKGEYGQYLATAEDLLEFMGVDQIILEV